MGTRATIDWYERDGKRTTMTGGRSGIAAALESSPANETTEPELIEWRGRIEQLEVALGDPGDRFVVLRDRPLNVDLVGAGKGNAEAVLRGLKTGERRKPGAPAPAGPIIHRLTFAECLVDLRGITGQYPLNPGINTKAGTLGLKHALVRSDGPNGKVLTAWRGAAFATYEIVDIDGPDGTKEYLIYDNAGPGRSYIRRLQGAHFGRGLVQVPYRTTENAFGTLQEGDILEVEDIFATDTGRDGAGVVNVWGGIEARIVNVNCDSDWLTFAAAVGFDSKQAEVVGSQGNWTIVGQGKLIPAGPVARHQQGSPPVDIETNHRAQASVLVDLRGSKIRTGQKQGGKPALSGRPAVGIDSAGDAWLVSDAETSVQSGGNGLELEWNGAGAIKTQQGKVVGTRSIGEMHTSGDFSGWDSFKRNGGAYHPDEDMSPR